MLKAIGGGPGVKKTCQAYFKEIIAVVSKLLRNVKIQLRSEDMTNSISRGPENWIDHIVGTELNFDVS